MLPRRSGALVLTTFLPLSLATHPESYPPPPPATYRPCPPPQVVTTTEICTVTVTTPGPRPPPVTVTCTETLTKTLPPPPPPPPSTVTCTETITKPPPPPVTVTRTDTFTVHLPPAPPSTVTSTETVAGSRPPPSTITSIVTVTGPALPPSTATRTTTTTTTELRAKEVTVVHFATVTEKVGSPPITVTVTEKVFTSQPPQPPKLRTLAEALVAAGCSNFLAFIRSNPAAWAIINSDKTRTVFAPSDAYFTFNGTHHASRGLLLRDDGSGVSLEEEGQATYQAITERTPIELLRQQGGSVLTTNNNDANLNGSNQKVVSDSRQDAGGALAKRAMLSGWELSARQLDNQTLLQSLVNVESGLGAVTHVINGDVGYDRGVIQVTDGLFTLPKNTSHTASLTGETTFSQLAAQANIQAQIDNTPSLTVFIPSNAAFDAASISANTTAADLARALGGHVVQSTLENRQPIGYLPNLVNGLSLVSSAGSRLQVTVKGENYFVNDALITKANLILKNGVAHVIDRVLTDHQSPRQTNGCPATTSFVPASTTTRATSRPSTVVTSQGHLSRRVGRVFRYSIIVVAANVAASLFI